MSYSKNCLSHELCVGKGSPLPQSPVIIFPDGLFASLYRKLVSSSFQTASNALSAQLALQMKSVWGMGPFWPRAPSPSPPMASSPPSTAGW